MPPVPSSRAFRRAYEKGRKAQQRKEHRADIRQAKEAAAQSLVLAGLIAKARTGDISPELIEEVMNMPDEAKEEFINRFIKSK